MLNGGVASGTRAARLLSAAGNLLAVAAVSGCALIGTPRIEDSAAPGDFYVVAQTSDPPCGSPVELVRADSAPSRPFRELARVSASCSPGAPRLCERRLLVRACELKADAVLMLPLAAGGTPPGSSAQSQVTASGRVVRWE
jgi:hypothetical protein